MNCNDLKNIEFKNLYSSLNEEEKKEISEHCEKCAECRENYNLYLKCHNFLDPLNKTEEPLFIKDRVNDLIDKSYEKSVFDFIFGLGHNPIKAGLCVGFSALAAVVLLCNIVSFSIKKPVKTENLYSSTHISAYSQQFYKN